MGAISEEELVDFLAVLVARETVNPPGNEHATTEFLVQWLDASPVEFDVECKEVKPDSSNVVARAGDPARGRLLLAGHLDVVPATPADWSGDPFMLQREDGQLIGRGVADMKGALAAKLLAAEAFLTEFTDVRYRVKQIAATDPAFRALPK